MSAIIPVFKPQLPLTKHITPYLEKIDGNRWYSNFGPLYHEFTYRIATLFNISETMVVSATNGTVLLELCLRAFDLPQNSLCVMAAWTFVATPLAATNAGLKPFFVDVNFETQALDPVELEKNIDSIRNKGNVGAVIVTAPFGSAIDTASWDQFTVNTGIPVIIDAAAAFDCILNQPKMEIRKTPMMVSLHATKIFGIGEGGLLFSTNEQLLHRIKNMTQFGFNTDRQSIFIGTNAKLSEYACAVALGCLDQWPDTRNQWRKITSSYQAQLEKINIKHMLSDDWLATTCNIILPLQANDYLKELEKENVMTKKWWGDGCHRQPIFLADLPALKHTEYLQKSVLGLPFYLDITPKEIGIVLEKLVYVHEKIIRLNLKTKNLIPTNV